jgi:hypothetical protein
MPFEILCNAGDYVVGAVLGQTKDKKQHLIANACKTLIVAQLNYTSMEKSSWQSFLL